MFTGTRKSRKPEGYKITSFLQGQCSWKPRLEITKPVVELLGVNMNLNAVNKLICMVSTFIYYY